MIAKSSQILILRYMHFWCAFSCFLSDFDVRRGWILGLALACLGLNSFQCAFICILDLTAWSWIKLQPGKTGLMLANFFSLCIKTGVCTLRALACSSHIEIFFVITVWDWEIFISANKCSHWPLLWTFLWLAS